MRASLKKRLMSLLLVFVSLLSLFPAQISSAAEVVRDGDVETIEIRIIPDFGGSSSQWTEDMRNAHDKGTLNSVVHSVVLDSSNNVVEAGSMTGATVEAKYYVNGVESSAKKVLLVQGERLSDIEEGRSKIKNSGNGYASLQFRSNVTDKLDEMWYFGAFIINDDGSIYKSTFSSIYVNYVHQKQSATAWNRVGMQVRVIDETPLGQYDYFSGKGGGRGVVNNNSFRNVSYFNVRFGDSGETTLGSAVAIENIDELNAWLLWNYIKPLKAAGGTVGKTLTLSGPDIVFCHDNGPSKEYLLAYYEKNDTSTWNESGMYAGSVNNYAGWGPNTKNDFIKGRYVSIVVNCPVDGGITVECYDEDNPGKLLKTEYYSLEDMAPITDSDTFNGKVKDVFAKYTDGLKNKLSVLRNVTTTRLPSVSNMISSMSTISYDAEQKKFVDTKDASSKRSVMDSLLSLRNDAYNKAKRDPNLAGYLVGKTITPPEIKNYAYDFGFGADYLASEAVGVGPAFSHHTDPNMLILLCSACESGTVKLYYKTGKNTSYFIKVRVDGVIDESLTLEVPANVGDVIKKEDVDTSNVPDDKPINDIENVPLTVTDDPSKNIIIIDCGEIPEVSFYVYHYLDTVLTEQETFKVEPGTTISTAPAKHFPGYKYDHATGIPLVVNRGGENIIRIYYVKDLAAPSASVNAYLFFDDKYVTLAKNSKSGYGFWGLFRVNITDLVEARHVVHYTVNGGCSPAGRTYTAPRYININVTAKATYTEGLPVTEANKNGKNVTVNLVKDERNSTEKVWIFNFPQNGNSQKRYPKAYVPINWRDSTNWTVNFSAVVTYDEDTSYTTSASTSCSGHRHSYIGSDKKRHSYRTYHNYTINPLVNQWTAGSVNRSGSASVMIRGSMYEDDFTGRKG